MPALTRSTAMWRHLIASAIDDTIEPKAHRAMMLANRTTFASPSYMRWQSSGDSIELTAHPEVLHRYVGV